jgi:hypothetical protein
VNVGQLIAHWRSEWDAAYPIAYEAAQGDRAAFEAGLPDPPPRPPHVLAEWPNFDFARPSYDRPPCDKCGNNRAYRRYGARRADERIPDGHLGWRTVPLCEACREEIGGGLISWLVERTGG